MSPAPVHNLSPCRSFTVEHEEAGARLVAAGSALNGVGDADGKPIRATESDNKREAEARVPPGDMIRTPTRRRAGGTGPPAVQRHRNAATKI